MRMNPMVIKNKKCTIDTQKPKERNTKILPKKIIKSQGRKLKEEEKKREELQK